MAAPVRFLSGRQQQQKIGIEGSTENQKVLEVVGRVGIGTTVFDANKSLDVRGDVDVSGIVSATQFLGDGSQLSNLPASGVGPTDNVNTTGIITASKFSGNGDFTNLSVSGLSTFSSLVDINANLDVTGHSELDDVNVSGAITATTFTGNLAGTVNTAAQPNITSVGTLTGLDVNGHSELDDVNVSGAITATTGTFGDLGGAGRIVFNTGSGTLNDDANLSYVDGTDTLNTVNLDVSQHTELHSVNATGLTTTQNLNVTGVSTFVGLVTVTTGDVHIAQRLFVGGLEVEGSGSENTFTGINTFTNLLDNTLGDPDTGALNVNGGFGVNKNVSFGSTLFVQNAIGINSAAPIGQLDVNGHTELDDVNVSGVSTFQGNVNLGDNDRLRLGDGADLQIYHDGNNSWIRDLGTGRLLITTDGTAVDLKTNSSSEFMARFLQDDAVELYYDNSKKFETTDGGIDVTGHTETDTLRVSGVSTLGTVKISSGIVTAASGVVTYYGDGTNLTLTDSVALGDDTTGNYVESISGTANQITVTGGTGEGSTPTISIPDNPTLPGTTVTIQNDLEVNRNLNVSGIITASTLVSDVSEGTSPLTVTSTTLVSNLNADKLDGQEGAYYLNYNNFNNNPTIPTVNDGILTLATSGDGISGSDTFSANQSTDTTFTVTISSASTSEVNTLVYRDANGGFSAGIITAQDFNSTSDENLKININTIEDPLAKVVQIRGVNFEWKENNKPSAGVVAQEIERVLPHLVSEGDIKTVNYNGLIGLLIETVKEQQKQIDSLNNRLSKLE